MPICLVVYVIETSFSGANSSETARRALKLVARPCTHKFGAMSASIRKRPRYRVAAKRRDVPNATWMTGRRKLLRSRDTDASELPLLNEFDKANV